jgi:hypothetical protein
MPVSLGQDVAGFARLSDPPLRLPSFPLEELSIYRRIETRTRFRRSEHRFLEKRKESSRFESQTIGRWMSYTLHQLMSLM